jgi:DNA-binding CsgD family transcriptional regulator
MFKQSISLVEFSKLYNILKEIEGLFEFKIYNYSLAQDFINEINTSNQDFNNSTVIVNKKDHTLFSIEKLNKKNILVFDQTPLKISYIIDEINTQLIKQKYKFQSKLMIKNYFLDLNSRTISNKFGALKLTEREMDIILYLKEKKTPQSIHKLQNDIWNQSSDLETHTVETHIYRLRKKIGNKFNDKKFIISHDNGYLI